MNYLPFSLNYLVFLRSVGVDNYGNEFFLDSNNVLFDFLFDLFLYVVVNNFSVMSGRVFLC